LKEHQFETEANMENFRINELLLEQIAVIQEFAPKLDINDMLQLEADLDEIEIALNKLKEVLEYLPEHLQMNPIKVQSQEIRHERV
jgi:hypothetical protein